MDAKRLRRERRQRDVQRLMGGARGAERGAARRLYDFLVDDLAVPFNIKGGCAVYDHSTGYDRRTRCQEWSPALERIGPETEATARLASPFVLASHILGNYSIALHTPSWLRYLIVDIDFHADGSHHQVLRRVLHALELEGDGARQAVLLRSPGGGYWVYLPLDRHWPAAQARQILEHHLDRHGLGVESGRLELFPSGVPLRAPCGSSTGLLVPRSPGAYGALELRHAREKADGRLQRIDPVALVDEFLDLCGRQARPLEQWLEREPTRSLWDEKWGPWLLREQELAKKRSEQALGETTKPTYGDVRGAGGLGPLPVSGSLLPPLPASSPLHAGESGLRAPLGGSAPEGQVRGLLRFGREFEAYCVRALVHGVTARQRHNAVLKLAFYFRFRLGYSLERTEAEMRAWLRRHGVGPCHHESRLLKDGKLDRFVGASWAEARHYLAEYRPAQRARRPRVVSTGTGVAPSPLADVDRATLAQAVSAEVLDEAALVLAYLQRFADDKGRVPAAVPLPAKVLEALCSQRRVRSEDGVLRRASTVAVEELQRVGLLQLHRNYSTGRRAREFTVWYTFGSGRLPATDEASGQVVLGKRAVPEGELVVMAGGVGSPPSASLRPGPEVLERPNSWWQRMYARRAFTPAEIFDAGDRRVLPGPFRDVYRKRPTRRLPSSRFPRGLQQTSPEPLSPAAAPGVPAQQEQLAAETGGAPLSPIRPELEQQAAADFERFLRALYGHAPKGLLVELRSLDAAAKPALPGPRSFTPVRDLPALAEVGTSLAKTWDVYIGVNPRRRRRGGLDDVAVWVAFWADLDCGPGKPYASKDIAAVHLESLRPAPSMIVDSGGGLQAYWLLDQPTEDSPAMREALQAFVARVGGDPAAATGNQILRPPATWNRKPRPTGPRPVRLLEVSERRYSVEELVALPASEATRAGELSSRPRPPSGDVDAILEGIDDPAVRGDAEAALGGLPDRPWAATLAAFWKSWSKRPKK